MAMTLTPFLWFSHQAEEAARCYTALFPKGRIVHIERNDPNGPAFFVTFEIMGQTLHALNGGTMYPLTPAFSLFVECDTQQEVDTIWAGLAEGGTPMRCGWVTDRFGLTWQVIPKKLTELLRHPDPLVAEKTMAKMLEMVKIEIAGLLE